MPFTKYILPLLLLTCIQTARAQDISQYPTGITIEPGVEKEFKKKDLNTFKIGYYVNDSLRESPLGPFGALLTPMVTVQKEDTLITVMNMIVPWGFQIQKGRDTTTVQIFVSSRSCKCYKSNLSDAEPSYGAGAYPVSLKLVVNKLQGLKKGDKIIGYIQATSAPIYHVGNSPSDKYEKWHFTYEGYFSFTFDPMN